MLSDFTHTVLHFVMQVNVVLLMGLISAIHAPLDLEGRITHVLACFYSAFIVVATAFVTFQFTYASLHWLFPKAPP